MAIVEAFVRNISILHGINPLMSNEYLTYLYVLKFHLILCHTPATTHLSISSRVFPELNSLA